MPHIHEKIDFISDTYIVNDGAVLLRMHEKHHIWAPPGGHVELNEDPVEAALREVKEEVGLDVTLLGEIETVPRTGEGGRNILPPRYIDRHPINDAHEHISMVYFATSSTREVVQGPEERSDDIRWFTKEDLEDPKNKVLERVRYYATKALEEASKLKK